MQPPSATVERSLIVTIMSYTLWSWSALERPVCLRGLSSLINLQHEIHSIVTQPVGVLSQQIVDPFGTRVNCCVRLERPPNNCFYCRRRAEQKCIVNRSTAAILPGTDRGFKAKPQLQKHMQLHRIDQMPEAGNAPKVYTARHPQMPWRRGVTSRIANKAEAWLLAALHISIGVGHFLHSSTNGGLH